VLHYISHDLRQWLSKSDSGLSIGSKREAPVCWPARSPDLNPLVLFHEDIKTTIYATAFDIGKELRSQVQQFSSRIKNTPRVVERLRFLFFYAELELCVREQG
jgi:hypothetical protein